MTANEMAYEFEVGYDSIANLDSEPYNDKEISHFLTKAQERVVKHRYNKFGNKYREGFEETEKRRNELDELIRGPRYPSGDLVTKKAFDQDIIINGGVIWRMPLDYWLLIYERVKLTSSDPCINGEFFTPEVTGHDEISNFTSNPFRSLKDGRTLRLDLSTGDAHTIPGTPPQIFPNTKRVELITGDNYDVDEYHIRYIKWPNEITVDRNDPNDQQSSELNKSLHREIVDEAVALAEARARGGIESSQIINKSSE